MGVPTEGEMKGLDAAASADPKAAAALAHGRALQRKVGSPLRVYSNALTGTPRHMLSHSGYLSAPRMAHPEAAETGEVLRRISLTSFQPGGGGITPGRRGTFRPDIQNRVEAQTVAGAAARGKVFDTYPTALSGRLGFGRSTAPGDPPDYQTNEAVTNSNPIDTSRTFVCQHYHDFLYRQSDQAGEDFWTQNIESCGANQQCRVEHRQDVSTAFFLSIEFQTTGYFVIRSHKAAFGNNKQTPRYQVFLRDQREITEGVVVGQPGFRQRLEANRQKYLEDFVTRPEFVAQFPQGMAAAAYVDKLFANTGATPTAAERNAAVAAYGAGDTAGRAAALKSVADSDAVYTVLYNPSFVLMQYYGYLRRNPDDAPDNNFSGYDFWLAKMDSFSQPGENVRDEVVALRRVRRAEMVRAFIESFEYRQRFHGAPGGNQQGSQTGAQSAASASGWRGRLARALPYLFDPAVGRFWLPS